MPKNKNTQRALTYGELSDFEQGYADALLRYMCNLHDAERWTGIGVEHLATEALENIRKDCRQFVVNMIDGAVDENGSVEVVEGLFDYELGRYLLLERMETGVGFGDLASVDDELRTRLIDAAGHLKPFELELDENRLVRMVLSPLSHAKLTQLQQGFADALFEFESQNQEDLDWQDAEDEDDEEDEDEVSGEWDGVTVHHFSLEALKTIVEDCEKFVADIVGDDRGQWDDLFPGASDHDLGWYLYLERQGAGVGLRDLLPEGELLDRVLKAADDLGGLSVEVGDDGQIHVHRQEPRKVNSIVWFEVSKEDKELLERMRTEGFTISISLDPDGGGVLVRKGERAAEWLFISEISLSDGRSVLDAKTALECLLEPPFSVKPAP